MSSSWASDYIKSEGMDPIQLSNLLGVSQESAATIVQKITSEGIDPSALSQRLLLSKEETVYQLHLRSLQDPQSQLSTCISNATQPLRQPVLTVLPHWQTMSQIVNQQTLDVNNNLTNLLTSSGPDAFLGQTADHIGLIQFDIHTKGNLLTNHVNNIIQTHQTFVDGTTETLSSITGECRNMNDYTAAAVMLEFDHEKWQASIFLPFAPPQSPQAPQQAPPQSPEGGSGLLKLILDILRNYWWLLVLILLVTALLDALDKWSKSMQSLSQENLGILYPLSGQPLALLADDLSQKYGVPLSTVEEIISKNPGLTDEEYSLLVQYYKQYGIIPFNVVGVYTWLDKNGKTRIFFITKGDMVHIRGDHADVLQSLSDAELLSLMQKLLQQQPDDIVIDKNRNLADYYYDDVEIDGKYYTIIIRTSTSTPGRTISIYEGWDN